MENKRFSAKKEKKKLKAIISQLPEDLVKISEGLVEDASFMAEQLEKLRDYIDENGWSEQYQNGANQFGKKISVEADSYIKLQKSYSAIIKQLTDLLPKGSEVPAAASEIMDFLGKGKK